MRHRTALNKDGQITHLILTESAQDAAAALAAPDLLDAMTATLADLIDGTATSATAQRIIDAIAKAKLLQPMTQPATPAGEFYPS